MLRRLEGGRRWRSRGPKRRAPWYRGFRRATPGKVWIHHAEHIELLTGALRAAELRLKLAELAETRTREELALVRRQLGAERTMADRTWGSGVEFSPLERTGLTTGLPITADGELDRATFCELVDEHIWLRRLSQAVEPALRE